MKNDLSHGIRTLAYIFLIAFAFITLMPLAWMLSSSFKLQGEIMLHPMRLPLEPTIRNYMEAWRIGNMGRAFTNSVLYSGIGTFATVYLAVAAAFALMKFGYKNSKVFFSIFTMGLLITVNSVIAPLFFMETRIGLYNTGAGVVIPYIAFGLPMAVLLACSYVKGIPDTLIEAAVIDGANYLQIFFRIIVIVATPVVATITILTFLRNWNEFILVFILTSGDHMRSLPVSINSFAGRLNQDYGMQLAALVIGTLPMILFYLFAHEAVIRGFGEGALKE
ncbi:MAG: carbohydrate ABC transporter permease [Spirochaetales bacterium]|nr:carbohydrate ABC transporter permease [Spirochaetales bacterium]